MGTKTYFKDRISDKGNASESIDLEFDITLNNDDGGMYIKVDNQLASLDHDTAKRVCDGMRRVAHYYGFDKDRSR